MKKRIDVLRQAVRLAGEAVRKTLPFEGVIEKEGRANIVTAGDLASEKKIVTTIQSHFPGDAILSEETQAEFGDILTHDHIWVIDPIDGTNNFRHQANYSGISVGYLEQGVIKAGAVYDPFRDELFIAERGHGAYLNDKKISVSDQTELAIARVGTDNSYDPAGTRRNLELLLKINPAPWVMMKGSAVLTMCEVAVGRVDVYFQTVFKPWDTAATFLLIEEAGGVVRGFDGSEITILSPEAIVGNASLVEQCVEIFKSNATA